MNDSERLGRIEMAIIGITLHYENLKQIEEMKLEMFEKLYDKITKNKEKYRIQENYNGFVAQVKLVGDTWYRDIHSSCPLSHHTLDHPLDSSNYVDSFDKAKDVIEARKKAIKDRQAFWDANRKPEPKYHNID